MELIGCPETVVTNYRSTLRDIPQERISHLHCGGKAWNQTSNEYFQIFLCT